MKILETPSILSFYDFDGMDSCRHPRELTEEEIQEICREAESRGYPCCRADVLYQYEGWKSDAKSYRRVSDTQEIFTPCGCNPFCLRFAEVKHPKTDWV